MIILKFHKKVTKRFWILSKDRTPNPKTNRYITQQIENFANFALISIISIQIFGLHLELENAYV